MPLLPTSSFKTAATVVITGVFSVAAAVIFTVPSVSHFVASSYPMIYDNTVFLLKPPYLYLVINCIIVSIVATSKLTNKSSSNIEVSDFSEAVTVVPVPSDIDAGYLNVSHQAVGEDNDPTVEDVPLVIDDDKQLETEKLKPKSDWSEPEKPRPSSDWSEPETEKPKQPSDSPEVSRVKLSRKPPRYSKQKSLKMSAEGGVGDKKPPRRQDTLETTWKKITEGHSTPLTKHLTKSDTWQERSHVQSSSEKSAKHKMTKSENLNDINAPTELKREPSPGQEELNRRVEAFIKKFNEEMRLQRLESLSKNKEMVNGGTRL
ncbi:hypothetical protein HID58_046340 [Brassica napus]|uniref:(rape) hypothetical protein n=1 Tax=Brassica napus TaxID=3708 RepID=A0A816JZF0_BRANA|nr:uncharacterized protein LOC106377880 isoform X1 [Brassica napus]KAH0896772.1 hypothetical protein HID58_046340 [Brassica napus]CAF1895989.1 unnamed protein product [Brassica napus]